jgi:predicted  nucleic acid-binding Zn-ribbon protein
MGALLVASVSSFTSCKDYDDDINDLRSQINGLNTSLTTTVNEKIATVNGQITSLTEQLNAVKAAYVKADEGLTASLAALAAEVEKGDAANASAIALNASAIGDLQKELVNLRATDANLTEAIGKLQEAQNKANETLKTQGETLVALALVDGTLEEGIKDAKAQAANALAEAQKAQTAAQTAADNLTAFKGEVSAQQATTNATLTSLQKQITDNLTTVNTKIDAAVTTLDGRIKTNETNIGTLQTDVATNKANLVTANTKLTELATKDKEISDALEAAKTDLGKKITDETDARVKALKDLSDKVTVNEQAIKAINELTIPQLIKSLEEHLVPETVETEVEKQLGPAINKALEVYMKTDDIKALVNDKTAANKSLIDALTDRVVADSAILAEYSEALVIAAAVELKAYADSMAKAEDEILAGNLTDAYQTADGKLNDSIDVVAANVATLKSAFQAATNAEDATSLAGRFKAIEDFFKADDAVSVDNLAEKIKETDAFIDAVEEAANNANGEILQMITAIHLFANQHMAQHDEYGKIKYTNGEQTKYPVGYDNFDHELKFVYAIEQGIFDAQLTELKEKTWNFPQKYVTNEVVDNAYGYTPSNATAGEEDVDYYQFIDGRYRSYEDSILVRVSPTNADLRQAEIALINSKGEDIIEEGLVELKDVEKYTRDGYITRGETGLWVIKFKLNDGEVYNKWLQYSEYEGRSIVYAVAVKNTTDVVDEETEETVERYVASEFDLTLATEMAKHAWDFEVNSVLIDSIHNRYIETEEAQIGGSRWTDDKEESTFAYELLWGAPCAIEEAESESGSATEEEAEKPWQYYYCCSCNFRPSGEYDPACFDYDQTTQASTWKGYDNAGYTYVWFDKARDGYEENKPTPYCYDDLNAFDRIGHTFTTTGARETTGRDNRHLKQMLPIEFNETLEGETGNWAKIEIEFPAFNKCGEATPIKGFFVTLDQQFSKESGNSEINAWWHYVYKNVALFSWNYSTPIVQNITLQKGNKGVIYIKDDNNLNNGDVIGFRVHAVNLDGTLYDPDGRAFYVQVGKQTNKHELSFDITVEKLDKVAYAVQNLVGGENPIVTYNNLMKEQGLNDRFFNRDKYQASYLPTDNYSISYVWREGNPAIRGNSPTEKLVPVAGKDASYFVDANTTATDMPGYGINDIFDFYYSEYADATIEKKDGDRDNMWTRFGSTYDNKVAANRLTQSVRAQINPYWANKLIDGATYKITAIIKRLDQQTSYKTVETIDIDITKNMPTTLPREFRVKDGQLADGVWQFYLRPIGNNPSYQTFPIIGNTTNDANNTWKINWGKTTARNYAENTFEKNLGEDLFWDDAQKKYVDAGPNTLQKFRWGVDARPYTFEEIFYGVSYDELDNNGNFQQNAIDQDYYFVFKGAGDFWSSYMRRAKDGKTFNTAIEYDNAYKADDAYAMWSQNAQINPGTANPTSGQYMMPAIWYGMLGKSAKVEAGYIYRNISANLNENGTAFLDINLPQQGYFQAIFNSGGRPIFNQDFVLEPQQVKVGDKDLTAKFACIFEKSLITEPINLKADGKSADHKTCTFTYGEDGTTHLDSMIVYFSDDKFNPNKTDKIGYVNSGIDKTWGTETYWIEGGKADKADTKKGEYLTTMIAGQYLYIDVTKAPAVVMTAPSSTFRLSDYYNVFWADANGSKLTGDALVSANVKAIGFERKVTTGVLPALPSDLAGYVTFPVVDVWNHELTKGVKLYFKINKPEHQNARQTR